MAERKSILLRLRPDLYEALQRWAQDEFRSVNGQIESILHDGLARAGRLPRPSAAPGDTPESGTTHDPSET